MRSTVINTSKEMTAYSDFPPPDYAANYMVGWSFAVKRYHRPYKKNSERKLIVVPEG